MRFPPLLDIYCSSGRYGPIGPKTRQYAKLMFAGGLLGAPARSIDEVGPELSELEQQTISTSMGQQLQRLLRIKSKSKGKGEPKVNWYPASAIPICSACESGRPA